MTPLGRKFFGIVLLLLFIFLAVSVGSYSSADAPDSRAFPKPEQVQNLCGPIGARSASTLLNLFGLATLFLFLPLGFEVVRFLRGKPIDQILLRTFGLCLVLVGLSGIFGIFGESLSFFCSKIQTETPISIRLAEGPAIGPGGYVGTIVSFLLSRYVTLFGGVVFLMSFVLAGFVLCADRTVLCLLGFRAKTVETVTVAETERQRRDEEDAFTPSLRSDPFPPLPLDETPSLTAEQPDETSIDFQVLDEQIVKEPIVDDVEDEERGELSGDSDGVPSASPALCECDFEEGKESESRGGLMNWLGFGSRKKAKPNRMQIQATKAATIEPETSVSPEPGMLVPGAVALKTNDQSNSPDFSVVEDSVEEKRPYQLPSTELLIAPEPIDEEFHREKVRQQSEQLEGTFADFGLDIKVVDIQTGPVISQFELELSKGLRLNRITALADDLAVRMTVPSVRVVPSIPGKNTVGVELPNEHRQMVRLRDIMDQHTEAAEKAFLPVFLGKDVSGKPMIVDLTKLPHLLIAGRTGTGKSVCLNSIIVSMLMTRTPEQVRMLMIDPKMVELSPYKTIPHLMHPVVTDMRKAEAILGWAVEKMEERYQLLAAAGVRQLSEYNKLSEEELRRRMKKEDCSEMEWAEVPKSLPYVVIIADEMADLMMTAGKEVETHIIRLAQKSRAVGIHLVLATQKPTVDVVTGLIKSNLPARIAFGVASRVDSQVVLDKTGAERLLGNGDMLFLQPGTDFVIRGQGTYVSDAEIEAIIEAVGTDKPDFVEELVALDPDEIEAVAALAAAKPSKDDEKVQRDELYYQAVEHIIQEGRGSLSLLQRKFSIGYGRAARLIDFMFEDGVVGPYKGAQAREVLMTLSDWRRKLAQASKAEAANTEAAESSMPEKKEIPFKPAVTPKLIDTSKEPRVRPKYPQPVFVEPEEDEEDFESDYEEEDYEDDDFEAENDIEYDIPFEYEEEKEYTKLRMGAK